MGTLLKLFTGNPMTIVYAALAIGAVAGSAGAYGGWMLNGWRLGVQVAQAERDRDHWKAEAAIVAAAVKGCNASVDASKAVSDAAIAATGELKAAAARLSVPAEKEVRHTETIIERRPTLEQAGDCHWAWVEIATPEAKARAP